MLLKIIDPHGVCVGFKLKFFHFLTLFFGTDEAAGIRVDSLGNKKSLDDVQPFLSLTLGEFYYTFRINLNPIATRKGSYSCVRVVHTPIGGGVWSEYSYIQAGFGLVRAF